LGVSVYVDYAALNDAPVTA